MQRGECRAQAAYLDWHGPDGVKPNGGWDAERYRVQDSWRANARAVLRAAGLKVEGE